MDRRLTVISAETHIQELHRQAAAQRRNRSAGQANSESVLRGLARRHRGGSVSHGPGLAPLVSVRHRTARS